MNRTVLTLLAVAAVSLSASLSACSEASNTQLAEPSLSTSTSASTEEPNPEKTAAEPTPEENPEETTQESSASKPDDELVYVDPERFKVNDGVWVITAGDQAQCFVKDVPGQQIETCNVQFADPKPVALPDPVNASGEPNIAQIDPVVGAFTSWSPGSQGHQPTGFLEPGETTQVNDTTYELTPDGTLTVTKGVHWFSVKDGVYENSEPPFMHADPEFVSGEAQAGEVCGEVASQADGSPLRVVALETTDCDAGMEVIGDYMSDSPSGDAPQGSGGFWTAPNGWGCARGYLFPGEPDVGAAMKPTCGADSRGGANDGSYGQVAAVPSTWEYADLF